jgi:signal transduction histidine kinase
MAKDARVDPASRAMAVPLGIRTLVVVPLRLGGHWLGVLICAWDKIRSLSEEERNLFEALPALLTPIVDNLRLVANLDKTVKELRVANHLANENARLKSEFLSTMSHELRTPLNAVEGFTSILLGRMGVDLPPKARGMVERIGTNSKRLINLINDFLDLSRIESGRQEIVAAPLSPVELAGAWAAQLGVLAEQKGIALVTDVDAALPPIIHADRDALTKITTNLLSNAIKFTHQGHVRLTLRADGDNFVIEVADTGIGIPLHAREYIFEEFRQVDSSSKREYGGTGLGLAIVNKLIRLMGGTVTVESEVGKGSTFTVSLPLQTALELA